jgi:hypothetical protein
LKFVPKSVFVSVGKKELGQSLARVKELLEGGA